MNEQDGISRVRIARKRNHSHAITGAILMAVVAFSLLFGAAQSHPVAYADVNASSETPIASSKADDTSARSEQQASERSGSSGGDNEAAHRADGANSAASSNASANQTTSPQATLGFELAIVAGIVIVIIFFVVWIIRLSVNIRKMDESMRSNDQEK